MRLIDEAQIILDEAGYKAKLSPEIEDLLYFEDQSLLGFVSIFSDVNELLKKWKMQEADFLMRHAKQLRTAPLKAWNVYSIFLTGEMVKESPFQTELLAIEEDFRGTRKIARGNIINHADVVKALFPLLPIQNPITLRSEDVLERLQERVKLPERALSGLLKGMDSKEIASILLEAE